MIGLPNGGDGNLWKLTDHFESTEVKELLTHPYASVDLARAIASATRPSFHPQTVAEKMIAASFSTVLCALVLFMIEFLIYYFVGSTGFLQVAHVLLNLLTFIVMVFLVPEDKDDSNSVQTGFKVILLVMSFVMFIAAWALYGNGVYYSRG